VNYDEAARRSVAARKPVVDFRANSDAAVYLQRIAHKLVQSTTADGSTRAGGVRR
jgi:MinD-like ATPase involved in chromosome partitioning or flagellar assembly